MKEGKTNPQALLCFALFCSAPASTAVSVAASSDSLHYFETSRELSYILTLLRCSGLPRRSIEGIWCPKPILFMILGVPNKP